MGETDIITAQRPGGSEATSQQPVLAVRDLCISVPGENGPISLVRDLSFDIPRGRTLAVVGESGSGKSVSALSIMRLMPKTTITTGGVLLHGRNLLTLKEREMEDMRGNRIGMIFQEPMTSLNPVFPIGMQIEEVLRRHGKGDGSNLTHQVIRLLDKVRIPNAARRVSDYPHQLSGGQRQRVMIAMALACSPDLLIADEPTTALDVTTQANIVDLIKQIQVEDQTAIMFITHDMGVVAEVADDVVVMRHGQAVEKAASRQIFEAPGEPYTQRLLSAVPIIGSMRGRAKPERFALIGDEQAPAARADLAEAPQETVLNVKDIAVSFEVAAGKSILRKNVVRAVKSVSFDLKAGETLSIVGESGCGKTTVARSVMGLQKIDAGRITIGGKSMTDFGKQQLREARRNIQMVFQDPYASLNPRIRIGDAIAEPMLAHGFSRAEGLETARRLLEEVGLSADMVSRRPHEFSGGQRQRICIARALALKPKVIVADEAVSALDVSVKAQVLNLFMDLQDRYGIGFLFISHDMAVVERLSHRVAVMYFGEIVEIGPRSAVFGNPAHPYTQRLLSAVPVPDPSRRAHIGNVQSEPVRRDDLVTEQALTKRNYRDLGGGHYVLE
ncbi:ABC transporter ATP-binding protein [Arvimicrobium flavum]|uniref:ABC transporter ATP-binding protein n=1 Tax=Arvimicrobium flavum TaxID=3393320 RepID=UPI00237AE7BB|nr:ABC transporter ATP-binding protein [Mesorhizobium shangrilense]